MALISQEALLGQLIPDVYINGITLETSGEEPLVDNPHIDDERENAAKLNSQVKQQKPLRAIIDVSIKEKLDNNLIGEWFREQGFQKYLKIAVFKTTSKNLISLFSENQYMINLVSEGSNVFGSGNETLSEDEVQKLIEATGKDTVQEAGEYLSQNFEPRVLSASLDSLGGIDAVSSPTTVDADGNTIKDYIYRVVFEHPFQPSDFAVFAVSYLDLQAMKDDYDLDFEQGTLENQNGKVVSEIVIKDGSTVSTSSVFLISGTAGEYWTGPIHQTGPNKFATGSEPSPNSKRLVRRTVPNSKLQDFRQIDEIRKYQLPIGALVESGFSKSGIILSNDKIHEEENSLNFTNLWMSRDSKGAARFMFGVDMLALIKQNSRYSSILDYSPDIGSDVIAMTKVKNIKVMRRRVKKIKTFNSLGSPTVTEQLFDEKEPYVSLVISGGDNGTLTEVSNESAAIRESKLTVSNQPDGMRYYTVQDRSMENITDGLYQYGVVIEFEDGVIKYLENTLDKLINMKSVLQEYLVHASKLGMTKKILEINDPHIDDTRERYVSSVSSQGHYDPSTNRFTDKFVDFCMDKYSDDEIPWIEGPILYCKALGEISETKSIDAYLFALSLAIFSGPDSGTPRGIMEVIALYEKLIDRYQLLVGRSSYISSSSAPAGIKSSNLCVKEYYWFKDSIFDSNISKRTGIDYISNIQDRENLNINYEDSMSLSEYSDIAFGSRQTRGLKIVDGKYWQGRVETETLKYFGDTNPDLTIASEGYVFSDSSLASESAYAFLSPSYVISRGRAYSLALEKSNGYYSFIETGLLEENQNLSQTGSGSLGSATLSVSGMVDIFPPLQGSLQGSNNNQTPEDQSSQAVYESIFAQYNVVVTPAVAYEADIPQMIGHQLEIESLDGCEERQDDPVDPYPAWKEYSDGSVLSIYEEKQDYKFGYAVVNHLPFFQKTSKFLLSQTDALAGSLSVMSSASAGTQSSEGKGTSKYELLSENSLISNMQTNAQTTNTIANALGLQNVQSVSQVVSQMPNQIKSLILGKAGSSVPKGIWVWNEEKDPAIDWESSAKFILNYEFLASIERFDGFEESDDLSRVKIEKWVPLTQDYYLQSSGDELLCRMRPFECDELIESRRESLNAPVYDEYFIMLPPINNLSTMQLISEYVDLKNQLVQRWAFGSEKINQFTTTNLITG